MRESHTIVLERNMEWSGEFATEPCETAWATEAIFFIRTLQSTQNRSTDRARVQISPDGMHWCDEGSAITLPQEDGLSFVRLSHFGGWLRLVGKLPVGASMKVIVYLALKE